METYDLVIENATILAMDSRGTTIGNGMIGIADGAISFVGEQAPDVRLQVKQRIDSIIHIRRFYPKWGRKAGCGRFCPL